MIWVTIEPISALVLFTTVTSGMALAERRKTAMRATAYSAILLLGAIVAVNVGTPLGSREDIVSLPGMLGQVISVTTIESDRRNLQLANLVITPQLGSYTLLDFKAVNAISAPTFTTCHVTVTVNADVSEQVACKAPLDESDKGKKELAKEGGQ